MRKFTILLMYTFLTGQSNQAIMTLYKDSFALIKQPVNWEEVPSGTSTIEYDQFPAGLFTESPFLNLYDNVVIHFQRLNSNVFSGESFFAKNLGEYVEIKNSGGKYFSGTLLEYNNSNITIQGRSEVFLIPKSKVELISIEWMVEHPQFKPTLLWDIYLKKQSYVYGELIYLSSGFDWNAVYRLVLNEESTQAMLIPEAVIYNRSDMDFTELTLQLVEGDLHRSNRKKYGTRTHRLSSAKSTSYDNAPVVADQQALGDYHIYNLSGVFDFTGKNSITVQLYNPRSVKFEKTYIFENREKSQREEPLIVELKIMNSDENNLGIPLPAGKVEMYMTSSKGLLEFSGEDNLVQTPKDGTVLLTAGRAFNVTGKRTVLNYDRQKKSEEASIQIQINNTDEKEISVRAIEHISGDWVIRDATSMYTKKDATTIYFPMKIKPNEQKSITYTYRKEWK